MPPCKSTHFLLRQRRRLSCSCFLFQWQRADCVIGLEKFFSPLAHSHPRWASPPPPPLLPPWSRHLGSESAAWSSAAWRSRALITQQQEHMLMHWLINARFLLRDRRSQFFQVFIPRRLANTFLSAQIRGFVRSLVTYRRRRRLVSESSFRFE